MDNRATEQILDWVRNRFFGKYRGLVTDNQDPTNRGRVKVRVPAVLHDLEVWAMPCLPYAGDNVGVYMIPEAGAGVWVEFEAGDPSFAIWVGGYWADDELPKNNQQARAVPSMRTIRSESGLMFCLDDDAKVITVSDENGNNFLTIEVNTGKIKVKGNMKVVVEAPQIELVENATHPLVFGDNLLTYLNQLVQTFNTHLHPGELALGVLPVTPAPPVLPFPPATPSLLSLKVKTG
jgi:uncharacterized protein involved in type VI secretion and phage assembly